MRTKFIPLVLSALITAAASAQNVGIGTSSPSTKLDVAGAIRHQETNNLTINSSGTNNVPANVSELQLVAGTVSAAFTLTATNTYYTGQELIVYNNTAYACTFGSYTIPAQQAMHFIYTNTPGSTSAYSWVAASPASSGGTGYIDNQTTQQASSNFNISGAGVVGTNLTIGNSAYLGNNNGGTSYRLYLSGSDANHYLYSTGSGGNSMYFGEYGGTYNFTNTNGGNTIAFSNGAVSGITSLSASSTVTLSGIGGNGSSTLPVYINSSNQLTTTPPTSGTQGYWTETGNYIYNTNSSNIGIGFTSGTPASLLANTTTNSIGTDGNGVGSNGLTWGINTSGYAGVFFNSGTSSIYSGLAVKTAGTAASNHVLDLSTGSPGSTGTPVMVALGNGAVGIGNSSPGSYLLNVSSSTANGYGINLAAETGVAGGSGGGSVTISGGAANTTVNSGNSGGSVTLAAGQAYVAGGCGSGGNINLYAGGNYFGTATNCGGAIALGNINFYTYYNSGTTATQAMIIQGSTNNVGIGTASPAHTLDVNGVINAATGYEVNGSAPSGYYLRGNGSNYVAGQIQASDLSTAISGTSGYHAKFTGSNTIGNSSVIYESGSTLGINNTSSLTGALSFGTSGTNNLAWGSGPYTSIYDNGNIHYWTDDVTNYESQATGTSAQWYWKAGVTSSGSGGSTWMTLTNSELGIGTTSPNALLTVNGNSSIWNSNVLTFYTDGGSTQKGYLGQYNSGSDLTLASTGGGNWLRLASNTQIAFFTETNFSGNSYSNSPIANFGTYGLYIGGASQASYPLDIETVSGTGNPSNYYYINGVSGTTDYAYGGGKCCTVGTGQISVYATGRLFTVAGEIDFGSDRRIKDVIGLSDNKKDLSTLMKMQVTDFTYKDMVENGTRPKKAFIAQQIEEVFPEAINYNTDFIPDVYVRDTAKVFDEKNATCTIYLAKEHCLEVGDTIRIISDEGKTSTYVTDVPSPSAVTVHWDRKPSELMFVYGRRVHDFRSIDYDRIYSLNVSATQELARELEAEKAKNKALDEKNKLLEQQMSDIHAENKATKADMDKMKASIETMQQILESKAQK